MNDERKTKAQLIGELVELRQRVEEHQDIARGEPAREAHTERQRAEDAFRESEEKYRLLADNATDVIWTTDENLKFTYFSPSVERLRQYTAQEALAQSLEESMAPDSVRVAMSIFQDELELLKRGDHPEGRTRTCELEATCKDGSTVWVEASMRFLLDNQGNLAGVLGISRDISERQRRAARQLALQRVRDEIWKMDTSADIQQILNAIRDNLGELSVGMSDISVNMIDDSTDPPAIGFYTIDHRGVEHININPEYPGIPVLLRIWRQQQVAYRRDLTVEDIYGERPYIGRAKGGKIRSIVDVPFAQGTLALNSLEVDAFSLEDIEVLQEIAQILSEGLQRLDDMHKLGQRNRELGREIAEREQAEEKLRSSEAQLHAVIESLPFDLWCTDADGRYIVQNSVCRERWGDTIGKRPGDLEVSGEVLDEWNENTRRVFAGEVVQGEIEYTLGEKRETHSYIIAPIWEGERIIGSTGINIDITDRRRLEEEVRRSHNLESLGLLAGGIAHDFNNVLTGVTGNLALLLRFLTKDSEEYEIAREAEQAASKTRDLTRQLMTFARGGTPVKETASIDELIREATELSLHGSNARPAYHFAPGLPFVDIDVVQMGQVIQNLVLNADQAMPDGGTVTISADHVEISESDAASLEAGSYVRVTVEDEGGGIPPGQTDRIFDPYFTTKESGHGLGLAICHSIIQRHKGHISVRSEIDVGTTFEFYLPASEQQAVSPDEVSLAVAELSGSGRILLMDDEETIHRMVGRALRVLGYEVESVYDGDEAMRVYGDALRSDRPYDLAIMDLTIPGGMGGKEAVGKLLELDPSARVLVSSGYANDPVMADYAEYGFAGRVAKPIDIDELAEAVSRALSERAAAPAEAATTAEEKDPDSYTILLVDDDAAIVRTVSRTLAYLGHAVLTAGDGESAVAMYREQHKRIDAVVLDYSLPKMSGAEAFHKMREISPEVRVLLATGHGTSDEVQKLLFSGVEGLLSKPYGIRELVRALAKRAE